MFQNLSESLILNKLVTLVLGNNCYDILFIFLQRWPHNDVTICLDSETKKKIVERNIFNYEEKNHPGYNAQENTTRKESKSIDWFLYYGNFGV